MFVSANLEFFFNHILYLKLADYKSSPDYDVTFKVMNRGRIREVVLCPPVDCFIVSPKQIGT